MTHTYPGLSYGMVPLRCAYLTHMHHAHTMPQWTYGNTALVGHNSKISLNVAVIFLLHLKYFQ